MSEGPYGHNKLSKSSQELEPSIKKDRGVSMSWLEDYGIEALLWLVLVAAATVVIGLTWKFIQWAFF